ncbi:MAG: hypothetical protein IJ353_04980 [Lachnospiraceae bacterium]|nr:hypothetical protein [Lachnospiraceae bacterium]
MIGILVDYYNGIPIVVTDAITKKIRSRTHRKKRIDKKWLRRYGYKEVTDHSKTILVNGTLYMSQKMYDRLQEELAKIRAGGTAGM